MQIEGDDVIFSTGKRMSANCGVIGISPKGGVTEGWDGGFFDPEAAAKWDEDPELTPSECVELADYMIERWQEFRAKYA